MAIISVLAALLLPAFWTVRGKAREMACASNLRQIGVGISLYLQDYDGRYPYAIDPVDRLTAYAWSEFPEFQRQIPTLPLLQDVLQPQIKSNAIFRCPSDSGFIESDFRRVRMDAFPSSFEKYGISYGYRTEFAARQLHEASLKTPPETNLLLDIVGQWHGTLYPLAQRYNVLFADGHVKNLSRPQVDASWDISLK